MDIYQISTEVEKAKRVTSCIVLECRDYKGHREHYEEMMRYCVDQLMDLDLEFRWVAFKTACPEIVDMVASYLDHDAGQAGIGEAAAVLRANFCTDQETSMKLAGALQASMDFGSF